MLKFIIQCKNGRLNSSIRNFFTSESVLFTIAVKLNFPLLKIWSIVDIPSISGSGIMEVFVRLLPSFHIVCGIFYSTYFAHFRHFIRIVEYFHFYFLFCQQTLHFLHCVWTFLFYLLCTLWKINYLTSNFMENISFLPYRGRSTFLFPQCEKF